jgi:hypothetical protein
VTLDPESTQPTNPTNRSKRHKPRQTQTNRTDPDRTGQTQTNPDTTDTGVRFVVFCLGSSWYVRVCRGASRFKIVKVGGGKIFCARGALAGAGRAPFAGGRRRRPWWAQAPRARGRERLFLARRRPVEAPRGWRRPEAPARPRRPVEELFSQALARLAAPCFDKGAHRGA